MHRRQILIRFLGRIGILAYCTILAACQTQLSLSQPAPALWNGRVGASAVQETPQVIPIAAADISWLGVASFPQEVNPLTGLPVSDPGLLARRPVMVKVSNYPPTVRPQSGLSFADMVFEYYIGEGTNRYLALYYGQDSTRIGSLRSGRLVDAQLARMYQSYLVYGSADPRVDTVLQTELGDRALTNLGKPCWLVTCGDTHLEFIYASSEGATRYAQEQGFNNERPNLDGMVFDSGAPISNQGDVQAGTQLGIQYMACNRGEWRYDPASGLYLRWIEKWDLSFECKNYPMTPLTDHLTGEQLAFSNVIVLFADYYEYNPTLHDIFVWDSASSRRAVFFRDGQALDGSWRAVSHDRPIQFFGPNGLPMALKPGNTWIIIASSQSPFTVAEDGVWEMKFELP